jgi:hypothetical protein
MASGTGKRKRAGGQERVRIPQSALAIPAPTPVPVLRSYSYPSELDIRRHFICSPGPGQKGAGDEESEEADLPHTVVVERGGECGVLVWPRPVEGPGGPGKPFYFEFPLDYTNRDELVSVGVGVCVDLILRLFFLFFSFLGSSSRSLLSSFSFLIRRRVSIRRRRLPCPARCVQNSYSIFSRLFKFPKSWVYNANNKSLLPHFLASSLPLPLPPPSTSTHNTTTSP